MLLINKTLEKSEKNRMHARNLAICFSPNIMRANDSEALTEAQLEIDIVEYIVSNFSAFFPQPYVEMLRRDTAQLEIVAKALPLAAFKCKWKRDGKL